MLKEKFFLGLDLGSSGVRIAIINLNSELIYSSSKSYSVGLKDAEDWRNCCLSLINDIPVNFSRNILGCAVDGTSGTLLACSKNGWALGEAIPYFKSFNKINERITKLLEHEKIKLSATSSLARAIHLVSLYGENILLRHQADWINGWLLDNWEYGEEGNNIRLGWDLVTKSWPKSFNNVPWKKALPKIVASGIPLGTISPIRAKELNLPSNLKIIAGTTDSNAAVLSASSSEEDGFTVLGSTIVIKRFLETPIYAPGITNHIVNGKYLCGGASNAGGAILKRFFSDKDLIELSRQIDPEKNSGLNFLPLTSEGERFPINNPYLKPIITPRPISESLYLHGLLEGLARIEAQGWKKLIELGAKPPKKIITIGGGSRNPQWRRIRERMIGIQITSSSNPPAQGVAEIAMRTMTQKM